MFIAAHNPFMPYITKTRKTHISSTNLYSKSNFDNSENFNLSKTKCFQKGSDQYYISSIGIEWSNGSISYFTAGCAFRT